ncbi:hypothetical protein J6590_078442 [Homalodisca vitripennis]|nr:hypothetical protein J6590_078442 [Homalodisca vitripennis]
MILRKNRVFSPSAFSLESGFCSVSVPQKDLSTPECVDSWTGTSPVTTSRGVKSRVQEGEVVSKFSSDPNLCKTKSRSKYSTDDQRINRLSSSPTRSVGICFRMTVPLPKRSLIRQLLVQLKLENEERWCQPRPELESKERWCQRTSSDPAASKRNDKLNKTKLNHA